MRVAVGVGLVAACAACTDDEPASTVPDATSRIELYDIPETRLRSLDLLIVLDDTTTFAPYRAARANLAAAIETSLRHPDSLLPDLRISVTTTTSRGALRTASPVQGSVLVDEVQYDNSRTGNYDGTFASALAALLDVEATSTAPNQPLASMLRALSDSPLLRSDAVLTILTITASDDASPSPVADYVTAMRALTDRFFVSSVYLRPSTRLDALHTMFPLPTTFASLDTVDYAASDAIVPWLIYTLPAYRCDTLPLDLDPETAGGQYDCSFATYIDEVETVLPDCAHGALPCFEFFVDSNNPCSLGTGRMRFKGFPATANPRIKGQCVVGDS